MAVVAHPITSPLSYKVATLTAAVTGSSDTDTLTPQVSEVRFTPSTQTGSWIGIGGNTVSDQSIATWTATLGMIQDVATTGLVRWLLTNEGKKCTFTLLAITGVTITFVATLSPAEIGGPVGSSYLTSTVTLAMDGKPVFS